MFDLAAIQTALRDFGMDGWMLHDFRGSNLLARRVLGLDDHPISSRRFYCLIPAYGEPRKLVHRIEPDVLDHIPGSRRIYLRWSELEESIGALLMGMSKVAMEYSPRNGNPYVSKVDAGTVEVVRGVGVDVVSSGDLVQLFEAVWDDDQWAMHLEADGRNRAAFDLAWAFIAERVKVGKPPLESEVQSLILGHYETHGLTTYSPPIVAVGPHSGNPHFENTEETDQPIKPGDFVLIDAWAKVDKPHAVYSDITRVGFVGESVPERFENVFKVVARARDAAIECVRSAFGKNEPLRGWQVDDAARGVIEQAGYGPNFIHRTGHNIGQETHGNGANMDNLETREERLVLRRTCFSVEPGIYLPDFGIRSEVNVFIDKDGQVHVTGGPPAEGILPILA